MQYFVKLQMAHHCIAFYTQLPVQLVSYDWQEEIFKMKAEWRSVSTMSGVLCVVKTGGVLMLLLYVSNLDIPLMVRISQKPAPLAVISASHLCQQMQ